MLTYEEEKRLDPTGIIQAVERLVRLGSSPDALVTLGGFNIAELGQLNQLFRDLAGEIERLRTATDSTERADAKPE